MSANAEQVRIGRLHRANARRRDGRATAVAGHCPGCGHLVRFSAWAFSAIRCGLCETPLIAAQGELDVESAVRWRLYRAVPPVQWVEIKS